MKRPATSTKRSRWSGPGLLVATVTDNNNETATASIDLGPQITIHDDGPSIDVANQGEGEEGRGLSLSVDESFLTTETNDVDGTLAPHPHVPVTDTADFSAAFTWVEGADGAKVTYALGVKLTQGGESQLKDPDSGLIDSQTGQHVYLHLVGDNRLRGASTAKGKRPASSSIRKRACDTDRPAGGA
jgi:hypothetical protein